MGNVENVVFTAYYIGFKHTHEHIYHYYYQGGTGLKPWSAFFVKYINHKSYRSK